MATYYEWDIEETDEYGDIVNHNHADKLKDLPRIKGDLVLVKDICEGSMITRFWAYVENDTLPTHFEDSFGRTGPKIPKRFHEELAFFKTKA